MKYHVGSQSFLHVRAVRVNKFFRVQLCSYKLLMLVLDKAQTRSTEGCI